MEKLSKKIMSQILQTRDEGQKEYAHTEEDVFANFKRVGNVLQIEQEKTLMVYLLKHVDGICAWVNGHRSQREDVRGRLTDLIVYSMLLWGMVEESEK